MWEKMFGCCYCCCHCHFDYYSSVSEVIRVTENSYNKKNVGERARERQSEMECFLVLLPYFVCSNQLKMLLTIIFYMLWLRFICLCIKYNMFETVRSLIFPSYIPSPSPSLCRAFSLSFSQTLSLYVHTLFLF